MQTSLWPLHNPATDKAHAAHRMTHYLCYERRCPSYLRRSTVQLQLLIAIRAVGEQLMHCTAVYGQGMLDLCVKVLYGIGKVARDQRRGEVCSHGLGG